MVEPARRIGRPPASPRRASSSSGFRAGSGEDGYRANVRALVKRVRQKFRAIDSDFTALENYPGFGYRWIDAD